MCQVLNPNKNPNKVSLAAFSSPADLWCCSVFAMGRGGRCQIMQRMWFSHSLKVINTTFYSGKIRCWCFLHGTDRGKGVECRTFRLWDGPGAQMGFAAGFEHIPGAPVPHEHLWAVRSWFPKNQLSSLKTPKWVILPLSHIPKLPLRESPERCLLQSPCIFMVSLTDHFLYKSLPVFQAPAARLCWERTKPRLDFPAGSNSRGISVPWLLQGFWQWEKKAIFQTTVVTTELFMGFFFFFLLFDKILLQELVFRDGSWRRKENIYFLFLLVNQNVLFKESALCRIAHELLPLMEIKEKYQEVFLVIPFPCLFFFSLNSLYTHVLAHA